MKVFFIKLSIFLAPIFFLTSLTISSLFMEPIDIYTSRVWEALSVLEKNDILRGPFYPRMRLRKVESGDTPHPQNMRVPKDVTWETDRYGYRKKESNNNNFDIIIIGDSQTAGSTLTQNDLLTEQLERKLEVNVYPFAPSQINHYIQETRFEENPPKVVILASAEKLFFNLPEINTKKSTTPLLDAFWEPIRINKSVTNAAVIVDRLKKKYFMEYFRANFMKMPEELRLRLMSSSKSWNLVDIAQAQEKTITQEEVVLEQPVGYNLAKDGSMVFSIQSDEYFIDLKEKDIYWQVQKMLGYKKYLESKGTRFLIVVIPNKENIYHDLVVRGRRPQVIPSFLEGAKKAGLETVDLQTVFEKSRKENPEKLLYHTDDGHWNSYGVSMAVEEIAATVKKML